MYTKQATPILNCRDDGGREGDHQQPSHKWTVSVAWVDNLTIRQREERERGNGCDYRTSNPQA
jgi:hypothetical protein